MILGFIKKLVKYYVDKLIHWMRMTKFNLELDNDIKKYHEELDKKNKKTKNCRNWYFWKKWLVYFYRKCRRWKYLR